MCDRVSEELGSWLSEQVGQQRERRGLQQRFAEAAWSAEVALFRPIARSPLSETRVVGDGFAVVTGQFDNTRNGVVCSLLPEPGADGQIASVLGWLQERRAPSQWLLAHRRSARTVATSRLPTRAHR